MIDLTLNEESKQYQQLARDFAQNEVSPKAESLDHSGEFPQKIYEAAWELGLLSCYIPESFGGLGLSLLDTCIISEEIAAACSGVAAALEGNNLAIAPLVLAGNSQQQEKYLGTLTTSCSFAGYCFTPTQTISGTSSVPEYKQVGGDFEINAKNILTLNAANSSWYFLVAREAESGRLSAFILDAQSQNLSQTPVADKLGRRCADLGKLDLDQVRVSKEQLLGEAGEWLNYANQAFCASSPVVAAHALGVARSANENALRYSKERFTFGQPISNYQSISFMLADMLKNNQAARLMTWRAAQLSDHKTYDQIQAMSALTFATDTAMSAATDAVQIYGGYGYSREYPVEKLMRDAKIMQVMLPNGINSKIIIGQNLVGIS